ncbi:MAG: SdpI family protein [Candidatus Doudnabacteria bacterium]|nr:SdpI family protein [Candidatus Doudnabacteria bacterium]
MFLLLPWLDPKGDRYAEFSDVFNYFKSAIIFVLFGIYVSSGFYNLGYPVPIKFVVPALVGLLLVLLGNFMGKIKRNWFVGVRTPWTLSSENVWVKTNRFGGFMMVLFGLLIILSPFLPKTAALPLFIAGAILATVGTFVYSFVIYKKEQNVKTVN